MPSFRVGVSPRYLVAGIHFEERVDDTEVTIDTQLKESLTIFIHLCSSMVSKTREPGGMVSADSCIEIPKQEQMLRVWDIVQSTVEIFIETVFVFRCGCKCWGIDTV